MKKLSSPLLVTGILAISLLVSHVAVAQLVQEVLPASASQPPESRSPDAWGAGVKLAASVIAWIDDTGFRANVSAKIKALDAEVKKQSPANGGALVVIGIQEATVADNNGHVVRSVLDGYVAGGGANAKDVLTQFLKSDRIETGVPKGFRRRNAYFWVTPKTK